MLPLTGQRWDINIYSRLLQITFRVFCLHFLSLICFSCLSPLRFQAVCPTPPPHTHRQPSSFHLHCFIASCSLHHGPAACGADMESRSFFYSDAKTPSHKKRHKHKHTPGPPNARIHTHTLTRSDCDIHLGFVMSDMAHVSLFCNYGFIYFFRLSRWVRSVPRCGFGCGNARLKTSSQTEIKARATLAKN